MQIRWILLFLNVLLQCCFWKPVTAYGNLRVAFQWKQLDYEWPSNETKQLFPGYKQEDNLPLGLEVTHNRIFVTVPRWRLGVVASLNYFYINGECSSTCILTLASFSFCWRKKRHGNGHCHLVALPSDCVNACVVHGLGYEVAVLYI